MKQKLFTRNFTFLIFGQISSLLGNYTLRFALSMYVLERTGSASIFAGLLALAMLPTILLSPFGGILADRVNRRNLMVVLDALSGLSVGLASFAMMAEGNVRIGNMLLDQEILVIGALLVVLSVLGAFESPAVQACVSQMLSGENLVKGNAVVSQVSSIAGLVTPFLGSIFYTAFGIRPVFYVTAVCFFTTAFLECFIRLDYRKKETQTKIGTMLREDFSVSMQFLCQKEPDILKLLLLAALISLFVAGTAVVGFPYLVRTVLGLSAACYGAAESAMGAAAVFGSLCVVLLAGNMRLRWLSGIVAGFGICLIPCGMAFLLPVRAWVSYLILMVMFCICQWGCSLFSTYAISVIQQRTPEHMMGKIMSYVFTLSLCAQPVGQIIYGALFDHFSDCPYWVLIPSGVIVTVIGISTRRFFRGLEEDAPGQQQ